MRVKAKVKDQRLIDEKTQTDHRRGDPGFQGKTAITEQRSREIAEEAKIGLGSIYDYVKSKDDILYLFFEDYVKSFYGKVKDQCPSHIDPIAQLEMTYRAFVESAVELEDQVMLAYTQAKYVRKDYLSVILHKESEIVVHFQKIIEEALHGKSGMDPFMEANFLVYSGVFGVLRRWILKPHYSKQAIVDYLVEKQVGELCSKIDRIQGKEEGDLCVKST